MTFALDIYRSATAMIDQHGSAAAIEAAMRADKQSVEGDVDGLRIWLRILLAIDELQGAGTARTLH